MQTTVHANKGWQYIGKVPAAGRIYADGAWCFNVNERVARTCNSQGLAANTGNYYVLKIDKGDTKYPYSGDDARIGQLLFRVGENGMTEALGIRGQFAGGEDLWMMMNDVGHEDNDGSVTLRFVSSAESQAAAQRMAPTNSYGDPIGTQYTRNGAGGYDKVT